MTTRLACGEELAAEDTCVRAHGPRAYYADLWVKLRNVVVNRVCNVLNFETSKIVYIRVRQHKNATMHEINRECLKSLCHWIDMRFRHSHDLWQYVTPYT